MVSKKTKKPSVSSLKKRADAVFSVWIRKRDCLFGDEDKCVCFTCGVMKPVKQMQNGHFISRKFSITRFDEVNCNAQCYSCNVMRYGEQYIYGKRLDSKYGEGTADFLVQKSKETHKFTIEELQEIIAKYRVLSQV